MPSPLDQSHHLPLISWLFSPAEASTTIPAGRPDVYKTVADPRTYPDWLAGAQHIRDVDPDFPERGSSFNHDVGPTDEVTVSDETVSEGARPPARLDLHVHAGPFTGHVEFHLRQHGTGTEVVLRERGGGPWRAAMPFLRLPLYLRNRGSLERLKGRFL